MNAPAIPRLLRLSLAPTIVADIVVGVVVGAGGHWIEGPAPYLLLLASLGIFHGAMAVNDWADRAEDARSRPDRVLPSGAVSPTAALVTGLVLMAGGVALAFGAGPRPGIWMGVVAVTALAYDLAGRGPVLGPSLLGACRFGNLGAGLALAAWSAGEQPEPATLAPALLYGAYVFTVSRLGRLEDREDQRPLGQRPSRFLIVAAVLLASVPLLGLALSGTGATGVMLSAVLALGAAAALVKAARRSDPWTRAAVGASMGLALRRLSLFTAALALLLIDTGRASGLAAVVALAGFALSVGFRRLLPAT